MARQCHRCPLLKLFPLITLIPVYLTISNPYRASGISWSVTRFRPFLFYLAGGIQWISNTGEEEGGGDGEEEDVTLAASIFAIFASGADVVRQKENAAEDGIGANSTTYGCPFGAHKICLGIERAQ